MVLAQTYAMTEGCFTASDARRVSAKRLDPESANQRQGHFKAFMGFVV